MGPFDDPGKTAVPAGLVDAAMACRAVELALPLLERIVGDRALNGSGVLHLVVMDPARPPGEAEFEQAILYEHTVGKQPPQWDADYAGYARAKARVSWRCGSDALWVQACEPWRLRAGDTTLCGGIVLDGLVVAASGAEAAYDEAAALTVAGLLRALARTAAQALSGRSAFLPQAAMPA